MRVSNKARIAIWILLLAAGYAGGLAASRLLPLPCNPPFCIAAGLALLSIVMRAAAVTGRYLAVYGKTRPGGFGEIDRLVTEGPYECMRHPMHLFLSMFPTAIGLLALNPGMAYITGPIEALFILLLAVTVDEKESIERFGEKYLEYRRRTPAINLRPSCLWRALSRRPPKPPRR